MLILLFVLTPLAPLFASAVPGDAYIAKITFYANQYGVSAEQMYQTIACESSFRPLVDTGDGGQSVGLVQINLPKHPKITREQALDPDFAIDYMAFEFATGHAHWWTCWRNLFAGKSVFTGEHPDAIDVVWISPVKSKDVVIR